MPDLSHETADDGFHEIQLNGKQLVFLFIVTTLVSVAIFLCGVLVGRGARAARGEDPIETAAQTPVPAPVPDAGPPSAEPPPAAAETPDELSYHKRLQAAGTPSEELKPPVADRAAPVPAQPRPHPNPTPAALAADVPTEGQPGTYVIQIQALRDGEVAAALVKRLVGKGYPAFLVSPASGSAPGFFKVQVGRYPDHREAEEVKLRLMKEEQFKPWITR